MSFTLAELQQLKASDEAEEGTRLTCKHRRSLMQIRQRYINRLGMIERAQVRVTEQLEQVDKRLAELDAK
jgi:hypothetical protein